LFRRHRWQALFTLVGIRRVDGPPDLSDSSDADISHLGSRYSITANRLSGKSMNKNKGFFSKGLRTDGPQMLEMWEYHDYWAFVQGR
jgi:hypothetical protein